MSIKDEINVKDLTDDELRSEYKIAESDLAKGSGRLARWSGIQVMDLLIRYNHLKDEVLRRQRVVLTR